MVNIHFLAQQANYRYAGGFLLMLGIALGVWKSKSGAKVGAPVEVAAVNPEAQGKRLMVLIGVAAFLLLLALAKAI